MGKEKRSSYRIVYKREAAKRFVPYFQSKLKYTKGKARETVKGVLDLLTAWRGEFSNFDSSSEDEDIVFADALQPPPVELPLPPQSRANGIGDFAGNRAVEGSGECPEEVSDDESSSESGDALGSSSWSTTESVLSWSALEASRNIRWKLF